MHAALDERSLDERIDAILDLDDVDDIGRAMALARKLVVELPCEPRALAIRSRLHFKCNDLAAAETDVDAALALDPHCADALWARTLLIGEDRDSHERAIAELDRLVALHPGHYGAHLSRCWRLHEIGRLDDAVAACEAALRAAPHRLRPANNAANFLIEAGRSTEAKVFLERLAAARPDDGMTAYNIGVHYYGMGDYERAIVHYDRGRRLLGAQNAIQHNRALTLQALGRHEEAVEEWTLLLSREPDWDWPLIGRERSLRALGRDAQADADHERWLDLVGRDSIEVLRMEPRRLVNAGDYAAALPLLEKMIAAGQVDPDVFNLAGWCHARLGRHAQARPLYERGLALDDQRDYLHRNLGDALLELDDPVGALSHAEIAIALDPGESPQHELRGKALLKLGRNAEAVASLERWAELAPQSTRALEHVIETLQSLGRHADALPRCDDMARLSPAGGWPHWAKGVSYEALGNIVNAKLAYQKAASAYLGAGETHGAELCRRAAENAGKKKRGFLSRLFGGKD